MKKNLILFSLIFSNAASLNAFPQGWLSSWFSSAESAAAKNNQKLGDELADEMRHPRATFVKKVSLPESVESRLKEVDVKTWRDESGLSLLDIAVMNGYAENAIKNAGGQLTEKGLGMLVGQMGARTHNNCLSEIERHEYEKMIQQYTQAGVKLADKTRLVWAITTSLNEATTECESEKKGECDKFGGACRNKKVFEYLLATAVAKNK